MDHSKKAIIEIKKLIDLMELDLDSNEGIREFKASIIISHIDRYIKTKLIDDLLEFISNK